MTNSTVDTDLLNKVRTVLEIVVKHIQISRRAKGLSPLLAVKPLEDAALALSGPLMTMEDPDEDDVSNEYTRLAIEEGYTGSEVNVSFFRMMCPVDKPETEIAGEILGFCTRSLEDYWEDYGFGVSWNVGPQAPGMLSLCLVLGLGYTDGSALVAYHINKARRKVGVAPLEVNGGLRLVARNYIALNEHPEHQNVLADLGHVGYLGSYAPFPGGRVIPLNVREMAMMVATQLLKEYRESLSRPDWQHIGLSIALEPILTPHEPRVPSILVEAMVAWRLDEDAERPAHFPQSISGRTSTEPKTGTDVTPQAKRSRRRWWPF